MRVAQGRRRNVAVLAGAVACALLAWCPCAFALNPGLDVRQYAHTAWRIREGFVKGTISSIAQTSDGYLWLGTDFGLLRFDGVTNVEWQPPSNQQLPSPKITTLIATRDDALWIGTWRGLARWKNGAVTNYAELAGQGIYALLEDRDGTVWASSWGFPNGRLCAIRHSGVQCAGQDGSLGQGVFGLFQDRKGVMWVGGQSGLWRWAAGSPQFYPLLDVPEAFPIGIKGLAEDEDGALLIGVHSGVRRLSGGNPDLHSLGGSVLPFETQKMFRDRGGGLWIGTFDRGIVHVNRGRVDTFSQSDGLSANNVGAVFEDREGNVWVATSGGLDRFRDVAVANLSMGQGLSSAQVGSIVARSDGSVWLATLDGLNKWQDGVITHYRDRPWNGPGATKVRQVAGSGVPVHGLQSLLLDGARIWISTTGGLGYLENDRYVSVKAIPGAVVDEIVKDKAGELWLASQKHGLLHLLPGGELQQTPWTALGHEDFAMTVAADPTDGGLWLGFLRGGVAYVKDGRIAAAYGPADGLGTGRVNSLRFDADGSLWAGSEGGFSRIRNGHVATLTSRNGLPCDSVHSSIEDDSGSIWLNMGCAIVRIPRAEMDAWGRGVDGKHDAHRTLSATVFDPSDGMRSRFTAGGYSPQVARGADGKLWFASWDGVSIADPAHLPFNQLPPPVHVERIVADRRTYNTASVAGGPVRLPPLTRDLEIDYAGLSFVAPERMRFRYVLDGYDRDWQDVGNRRQAFYTNLPPRNYRFRVIASNNSGVWNEAGAALDFSIAPAYYQTVWFRTAVVVAALALLWAGYRYRVGQVAAAFDARLQERVNERTRIARDLHDTLLQSFHGLLFRFQASTNKLSDSPVKREFETAIDQASQAIAEGRDAVQNLRTSTAVTNDLAEAIGTLGAELAAAHIAEINDPNVGPTVVGVAVEGTIRDLHPIIRDDVYRIAGEALRNAFCHARARHIEVQIRYDDAQLRVRLRDDGRGIDPAVRDRQKPGHFGLPGMRERAELVGGHLTVWSEVGLGTEVQLSIPAAAAYATPRARGRSWLFVKRAGMSS